MRRELTVITMASLLGLAACGGSGSSGTGESGDTSNPASVSGASGYNNPITGPIDRARDVVGQQNAQLQQEEQQTGYGDPTSP